MKMRVQELHPMLIHAPLTLLPSAVAIDVAAAFSGGRTLDKTARILWWSTAAGGVVAGIAGLAASQEVKADTPKTCLLYTSPSPRDFSTTRMPSSA